MHQSSWHRPKHFAQREHGNEESASPGSAEVLSFKWTAKESDANRGEGDRGEEMAEGMPAGDFPSRHECGLDDSVKDPRSGQE